MKLFPYQREGVRRIEGFNGRALLGDEMGLGKTVQALTYLRRNPDCLPAVVVCPAAVKYHWEHEAINHVGIRASVLEGQRNSRLNLRQKLTVVNYDILRFWVDELKQMGPQAVIIDECHYCGNPSTKRTKAVRELCRGVSRVVALSGTPLVNRPIELFPTLNIIRPDVFKSRWSFGKEFCGARWSPWGWVFDGATRTHKLHQLLTSTCMIRRRKSEVLSQLPPKNRRVLTLPMRNEDEYADACGDFINWLRRQDPIKAHRAAKAEALVKMGYLMRLSARLKLKYVVEWINEFLRETDEKLVVFAVHKKAIHAICRRAETWSILIDGSVTGRDRKVAVDEFQNNNKMRLLVGNIRAAGVGITLTAASTVMFAELTWRPGDHTQAEDRIHRIGARRTASCWYLVAHGTIEERLCELIQQKQQTLSAVLDGGPTEGDLDVFDQLLGELRDEED